MKWYKRNMQNYSRHTGKGIISICIKKIFIKEAFILSLKDEDQVITTQGDPMQS